MPERMRDEKVFKVIHICPPFLPPLQYVPPPIGIKARDNRGPDENRNKISINDWYAELQALAAGANCPWICTGDAKDYQDAYDQGLTPVEYLDDEISCCE